MNLSKINTYAQSAWDSVYNEAKAVIPAVVLGSCVTLTDPRGLAIALIGQDIFMKVTLAAIHKLPQRPLGDIGSTGTVASLVAIPTGFFVGRDIAQLAGFDNSITSMLLGRVLGVFAGVFFAIRNDNAVKDSSVVILTEANFHEEVEKSELPVIVDVYAPWCGPCNAMAPAYVNLSKEIKDVKFAKLNVDKEPELAKKLGITAMPTLLFYKDGKCINMHVGALDREKLFNKIKENLPTTFVRP